MTDNVPDRVVQINKKYFEQDALEIREHRNLVNQTKQNKIVVQCNMTRKIKGFYLLLNKSTGILRKIFKTVLQLVKAVPHIMSHRSSMPS